MEYPIGWGGGLGPIFIFCLFLAVMSSSISDVVTQSVCKSVRLSVTKELFLSLNSFDSVSRKFEGCLKFEECLIEVSRKF